ncbi:MAG: hypothetical protein M3R24_01155 [Chloroflexota bacterium]|nr:hypothetical protein [Chloroflexota bacterium]
MKQRQRHLLPNKALELAAFSVAERGSFSLVVHVSRVFRSLLAAAQLERWVAHCSAHLHPPVQLIRG